MTAPNLTPATRASLAIDRARTSSSETAAQVALLESIAHSLVRIGDLLEMAATPVRIIPGYGQAGTMSHTEVQR